MKPSSAIIGSSTGIGRALLSLHQAENIECVAFSSNPEATGYHHAMELDLTKQDKAASTLDETFSLHPEIETIFLVSGTGDIESELNHIAANETLELNCKGFTVAAYAAIKHLEKRGKGSLVAVTSVAAIRGGSKSLTYNASKAYQRSLLEGLRCRVAKKTKAITITEVRAGFVDTAMMKAEKPFWVATPEQAAKSIFEAARRKKELIYVLARWRAIGWLLHLLPSSIYKRIG